MCGQISINKLYISSTPVECATLTGWKMYTLKYSTIFARLREAAKKRGGKGLINQKKKTSFFDLLPFFWQLSRRRGGGGGLKGPSGLSTKKNNFFLSSLIHVKRFFVWKTDVLKAYLILNNDLFVFLLDFLVLFQII